MTTPVLLAGKALFVNAATAAGGLVRVELQNTKGTPLAGFELEACQPLQGDELHHRVQWREREIAVLEAQPVQIRFVLDQARFYGYSAQCPLRSEPLYFSARGCALWPMPRYQNNLEEGLLNFPFFL